MGTRADFYLGKGMNAEWLGSIAWDGYPQGMPEALLHAHTAALYREQVEQLLTQRDDSTRPEQGWPWPWDDSNTTDYAYTFYAGHVYANNFGNGWFLASRYEVEDTEDYHTQNPRGTVFPDMAEKRCIAWDKRSGLLIIEKGGDDALGSGTEVV